MTTEMTHIFSRAEVSAATGLVPTLYETCTASDLELEDLERLFPDGYQRGVVKIAGLRVL